MIPQKGAVFFVIAYFTIGFFSLSTAQVLDKTTADSLIRLMATEDLPDTTKYRVAMDISDYITAPRLALLYAQKALQTANQQQNLSWQAAAWLNIGQAHEKLGNSEKAQQALFNSLSHYQSEDSQLGIASVYLAFGNLYNQQRNLALALQHYNKSINIFREVQDTIRLATALLNVSEVYQENKQYDSALLLLQEATILFEQMQFDVGTAYATGNTGIIKVLQGEDREGEVKLMEAIETLRQVSDNYAIAEYQLSLAEIYQSRGDITKAVNYAQQGWQLASQDGLLEQMRNASERLSLLFAEQGNYEPAYRQLRQYLTLKDSINNEEVVRRMADMRTEFEVAQKQVEIDALTRRRNLQRIIQVGLILLSLLVVAVAWLYYRNYRTQKQANQQLSQQQEELRTQNETLDALIATRERFFSIISHDLRGPVHAFHGLSLILKMHLESKNQHDLPTIADHIEQSALQLSMLLDNLLNWATNQRDNVPLLSERLLVKPVANEVVSVFKIVAVTKQIQLSCSVSPALYVWVDRNALFTILRNLVNNALKFTPEGGEVRLEAEPNGDQVHIRVIDTGIGIPSEKLATLFQSREGEKTWGTAGEQGVGLGLSLVQEFVSRSGGTIRVTSEPGQGTTFIVQLPTDKN